MSKSALRHPARVAGASLLRLQSDERLAELAVAGHDAAFDAIVLRYRPALLRYCGAIVGSSRAEDAVQQTLINAHAALGDADEVRHLRSWLYRIAHNVSLNVLRGVRDEVPLDADGVALPMSPSPSESFESSERFQATVAALRALPERQRAALVLRELEGRSHEEIAEVLGVSAGSARQHLMRARVTMRGAVTALTPWGLIARLAELASAGGGGGGGLETAAGAGLGVGLAKLTASVMATGALLGGAAVGTREVVRNDTATPARADTIHRVKRTPAKPRAATTTTTTARAVIATPTTTVSSSHSSRTHDARENEHHRSGRGHGRDDSRTASSGHGPSQPQGTSPADDHSSSGQSEHSSSGDSGRTEDSTTSHGSGSSGSGRSKGGSSLSATETTEIPTTTVPSTPTVSGSSDSGSGDSSGSSGSSSGSSGSGKSGGDSSSSGSGSGSGSGGSHGSGDDG
jgi:RNA polymerase sigma factor (sigma-70 family)